MEKSDQEARQARAGAYFSENVGLKDRLTDREIEWLIFHFRSFAEREITRISDEAGGAS